MILSCLSSCSFENWGVNFFHRRRKIMNLKGIIKVTICLLGAILFMVSANTRAATIEVSQPTHLTDNGRYDRNPSIINYEGNYWLFYTKADSGGVRGKDGYDPDTDTYVVYYKAASTIEGLSDVSETKLELSESLRPINFDQRVVTAVTVGSDIYAIVSSGQSGTNQGMYYYKYSGGGWAGPTILIQDTGVPNRGGYVNAVSDGSTIYIVWECSDGTADFYTFVPGNPISAKMDLSNDNMPKITVMDDTLYVVSIEDGTGDIKVYSSDKTTISWSHHSTAITGAGLYDPCIFNDGTDLYVVSAPYVSANDQQYLIQTKYNGDSWATAKRVSYGGYDTTYWWDYWPVGYHDGTNAYVFFTTETASPTFSDAEIAYLKMDWDLGNNHYCYIQNAIDQANSGDNINVAAGTYNESGLKINKSLDIIGTGIVTITGMRGSWDSDLKSHHPARAPGTYVLTEMDYVVGIHNGATVNFTNIIIDGQNNLPPYSSTQLAAGVAFYNAGGSFRGCEINNTKINPEDCAGAGISIYVDAGSYTLDVDDCEFNTWGRNAIQAYGSGLTLIADSSTFTGNGDTGPCDALQNGIVGCGGLDLEITNSTFKEIRATGAAWEAIAVMAGYAYHDYPEYYAPADDATVSNCDFYNTGDVYVRRTTGVWITTTGTALVDSCTFTNTDGVVISAENNGTLYITSQDVTIKDCDFTGPVNPVSVDGQVSGVLAQRGGKADVQNCTFDGFRMNAGTDGLGVAFFSYHDYSGSTGGSVTGCEFSGNDQGIYSGTTVTPLAINYNSFDGTNSHGVWNNDGTVTIDASGNWWGDASGPSTAKLGLSSTKEEESLTNLNPADAYPADEAIATSEGTGIYSGAGSMAPGTGDAVTDYVDYSPWWGADYVGNPHTTPWTWYVNTSNNSTIQEGVDAASAGDTLRAQAGTYVEDITIDRSLTLIGEGTAKGLTLVKPGTDQAFVPPPTNSGVTVINVTADSVTVKDLKVDGTMIAGDPEQRTNMAKRGIYGSSVDNLRVEGCEVIRCVSGIVSVLSTNLNFHGNTLDDCGYSFNVGGGIYLWGSSGDVGTSSKSNVLTNIVDCGIIYHSSSSGEAKYNHLTNCELGMLVNGNNNPTTFNHNDIDGSSIYGGIQVVHPGAAVTISNNSVLCDYDALLVWNTGTNTVTATDNHFYYTSTKGSEDQKHYRIPWMGEEYSGKMAHRLLNDKSGESGIYLSTESDYGDGPVHATITGNIVAGYDYDVVCHERTGDASQLMDVNANGSVGTNYFYGYGTYAWYMDNCDDDIDAQYNYWATTTPEDVIWHKFDDASLGEVNFDNYQIPEVSLFPSSQMARCGDTDTLWINLDERVLGMEAVFCSLSYDNSYITADTVIDGPDLPASSFSTHYITSDRIVINVGILSGNFDGPGTIFGIILTSDNQTVPDSTGVLFEGSDIRNSYNQNIPHTTSDAYIKIDCTSPQAEVLSPDSGLYFNYFPDLEIHFTDNVNLDRGYYQMDDCHGTWIELWSYDSGSNDTTITWPVPSVTEGHHNIYFKVTDDEGNTNFDSCTYWWSFYYDITPPDPPTNFVARPGHEKCKLSWTNPTGDPSFHKVMIRCNPWAVGAYPEYDDEFPTPLGFPGDHTQGTLVCTTFAESYKDSNNTTEFPRNAYFYGAFSYDKAGNFSTASASAQDTATNYWLGDVAGPGGLGDWDGYIYYEDLTIFSMTFGKYHGEPGYQNQFDIGPTYNGSPKGIPMTDNWVNFYDLSIFAINFDAVNPNMKIAPIFAEQEIKGRLGLHLVMPMVDYLQMDEEFKVKVLLRNNTGVVKSIHFVIPYDPSQLEFVRVEKSRLLQGTTWPVFFDGRDIDNNIDVSLALLGGEVTIGGSGEIATITFRLLQSGNPSLAFSLVDLRDNKNHKLLADGEVADAQTVSELPSAYGLHQNYPNVFNLQTQIAFQLPQADHVCLKIYNIKGELVRTLVNEYKEAGYQTVIWDGRNQNGEEVASGVYFYRMVTVDFTATKKMIMLK